MALSLRVTAIASLMAIVAFTSAMAQTTGTIPPPALPSQPALPPPTANQYSSNEIIDAAHHFCGSVSHGLAMVVEKAVSQWGLPNGYILGEEASGAFIRRPALRRRHALYQKCRRRARVLGRTKHRVRRRR